MAITLGNGAEVRVVPPSTASVTVVPVPGPPGPAGPAGGGSGTSGSISAPVVDGGELDVTVTSNWGIDPDGHPYYNSAGAASADAAIATLGPDGRIVLTDTRGGDPVAVAVTSVNGHTGAVVVLVKADVGLALVDNVSDVNKPVSSAAQTALNLKANTASLATVATSGAYSDLSGKPTIPAAFADLTGSVSDAQIPAAITRDSELTAGLSPKANTSALAPVALSGAYADLTGKPTIPSAALAVALAVIFGS